MDGLVLKVLAALDQTAAASSVLAAGHEIARVFHADVAAVHVVQDGAEHVRTLAAQEGVPLGELQGSPGVRLARVLEDDDEAVALVVGARPRAQGQRDEVTLRFARDREDVVLGSANPSLQSDALDRPRGKAGEELAPERFPLVLRLVAERGQHVLLEHVQDHDLDSLRLGRFDHRVRRRRRRRSFERYEDAVDYEAGR